MPPINEPFHRVKQSVQSTQGHRPRMSGLDGGLCVPSEAETLREKKTTANRLMLFRLVVLNITHCSFYVSPHFCVSYLPFSPHDRLKTEVDAVVSDKEYIPYEDLSKLEYSVAVSALLLLVIISSGLLAWAAEAGGGAWPPTFSMGGLMDWSING